MAATIDTQLRNLQPLMHPLLHPEFVLTPPRPRQNMNGATNGHGHVNGSGPSSSIQPLTAAEQDMEVIKKRRDVLNARAAAQNQPPPQPTGPSTSFYPSHQQPILSPPPQHNNLQAQQYPQSHMHVSNSFQGWVYNDFYAPGTTTYNPNPLPMSLSTSSSGSSFGMGAALAPYDDNTNMSSRRPADTFNGGLAKFSLDPTKISHPEKISKKHPPEGGKCHSCSVTVTAEWRRGPDGPRSLCNACGVSP